MPRPLAMLRLGDVEPLMSILPMFEAAGWDVVLSNNPLNGVLRDLGCRNVDNVEDMVRRWGAEPAPAGLREVGPEAMPKCSLYVDVNGNHNGPKVWNRWPHLKNRVLTYFINGGEPRKTDDKGDCQTPATPMMTTAQHYRSTLFCPNKHWNAEAFSCDDPPNPTGYWTNRELSKVEYGDYNCGSDRARLYYCPHGCGPLVKAPWLDKVYTFYPAFTRGDRVLPRTRGNQGYAPPVSFVHNCKSWGSVWWEMGLRCGVKEYGGGSSPSGLVQHPECFKILSTALCTVYIKSGGAVDYSILEPMACACPTTFHVSYVHNCRLYDLLEPGITCLTWDTEKDMLRVIEELKDPARNHEIGEAGRQRMYEVTWNARRDGDAFKEFVRRMFP